MDEITALREVRPAPAPAELEAMRRAARERFMTGAGPTPTGPARRWRLPALVGGLTAATAGTAAGALVLTAGQAAAPSAHGPGGHTQAVVTAAWTVREDASGTVTVYLRQYADPAALQRTLRADGINAIVRPIPYAFRGIAPIAAGSLPGSRKSKGVGSKSLRVAFPTCIYAATDNAPMAVQRAVVTIVKQDIPVFFVIHRGAMPPGSALFLSFMANVPAKTGARSNWAMKPWVLKNDTVPACVPVKAKFAPNPVPAPKVKATPAITPKAG
jgi:hypothetical protein